MERRHWDVVFNEQVEIICVNGSLPEWCFEHIFRIDKSRAPADKDGVGQVVFQGKQNPQELIGERIAHWLSPTIRVAEPAVLKYFFRLLRSPYREPGKVKVELKVRRDF